MERVGTEVLDYPLPSPAALAPPAEWDRLRRECPVAAIRFPSDDTGSLVTRYDDVKQVLADRALDAPDAARISATESGGVFSVKRMNALRLEIEAKAESLIDDMVAKGASADLKSGFGFPLPVRVICTMLGIPDSDRNRFATWSDMILDPDRYSQDEVMASMGEFWGYLSEHIAAKRAEPGDDILSELITGADSEGEPMSDEVLAATGIALLVAGHETTANMIGKMVAMLLADHTGERSPNPHLSFGVGAHSCLGQALARTEPQIVLEVLPRRLPTLELAVEPDELVKLEGLVVGGLTEVPVRW